MLSRGVTALRQRPGRLPAAVRTAVAALLVGLAGPSGAQGPPCQIEFPRWAGPMWHALARDAGLALATRVDPCARGGDFDGDGRADLALLVAHAASAKEGIALLLQGGTAVVLGAGTDFGNGGDDFSWMDHWHVQDRGTRYGGRGGPSFTLPADGLVVARDSSASALIHLRNGRPQWRQLGD